MLTKNPFLALKKGQINYDLQPLARLFELTILTPDENFSSQVMEEMIELFHEVELQWRNSGDDDAMIEFKGEQLELMMDALCKILEN